MNRDLRKQFLQHWQTFSCIFTLQQDLASTISKLYEENESFLIENLFRDQVSVMKLSGQLSVLLKYTVVIVDSSGTKR